MLISKHYYNKSKKNVLTNLGEGYLLSFGHHASIGDKDEDEDEDTEAEREGDADTLSPFTELKPPLIVSLPKLWHPTSVSASSPEPKAETFFRFRFRGRRLV